MAERRKKSDVQVTGIYTSESNDGVSVGLEHVHTDEHGELHHLDIWSDSEDAESDVARQFKDIHGDGVVEGISERRGKSTSFGFSSKRWNSSWNPEGPKKNWVQRDLENDLDVN